MNRSQMFGVGGLAAGALLLESALTRLLAVAQFYHFAFLVVSLALLGFGASGSVLTLRPDLLRASGKHLGEPVGNRLLAFSGAAFSLSVIAAYAIINLLPFDSYSIAWDRRQVLLFALYYTALALPFVFAGIGIGGILAGSKEHSHLVYAGNLLGSAFGVLLALVLLGLAGVPGALLGCVIAGLLVSAVAHPGSRAVLRTSLLVLVAAGIAGVGLLAFLNHIANAPLGVTISPYKGLAYARLYPGAASLFSKWNAVSRLDILKGAGTRALPGLSYIYLGNPPPQHGLSIDADSLQPVTLVDPGSFTAAEFLPEAIAFQLKPQAKVLVLEPGAGLGVLQAVAGGARDVSVVSSNPLLLEGARKAAGDLDIFAHPRVQSRVDNPRSYLRRNHQRFEIVFLPLTDAYRPVSSGAYSLAETYLLTAEAFADMLALLGDKGILVTTRWLQVPPSEDLRLVATLDEALESLRLLPAEQALVAYRGIQTITILVKPSGWSASDLTAVREFTRQRRYDLIWAPGIHENETNRFNRLHESEYYRSVRDLFLSSPRHDFYRNYAFAVQPVTDNQPFFYHFFTWKQVPDLVAAYGKTMQPFGGSGFFILFALLGLVLFLSLVLIVVPLLARKTQPGSESFLKNIQLWRVLVYFGSLGLAFLFIEIPLIQQWILLLGHPAYAFTLIVLVILSFSSLGSILSRAAWLPLKPALWLLVGVALLTPWTMLWFSNRALGWSQPLMIFVGVFLLAPLGLLMGLPFPIGLAWLEKGSSPLIPWAWAVNGSASVIAAVLAAILALGYGFQVVLFLGAGFYLLAVLVLPGQRHKADSSQIGSL